MNKIIAFFLLFTALSTTCFSQTLHIYGGQNHDECLGCLNCNNYNKNSIWNDHDLIKDDVSKWYDKIF